MSNTSTAINLNQVAELEAKEAELKAKKSLLKQLEANRAWEAKTKERNPAYVVGSLRRPTEADHAALTHIHGWVCDIECLECGTVRVVNKQDAFQARYCAECRVEARKANGKVKRLEKKLSGKSPEDLAAEIAKLDEQLAAMG